MSSAHRRRELAAQREAAAQAEEAERSRVAGLYLDERIEEIETIEDVKNMLREIASRAGVDLWTR